MTQRLSKRGFTAGLHLLKEQREGWMGLCQLLGATLPLDDWYAQSVLEDPVSGASFILNV